MGVAITFAAIASTGTAFMEWFLIALLRQSAPSTRCRIMPIRHELEKESPESLSGSCVDGHGRATGSNDQDYYAELLENYSYAKQCASGLIALDVCPVADRVGGRSIHSKPGYVFRERRI